MKIIILKNKKEVGKGAAFIIADAVRKNPNMILGLASGRTVIPLYKELVRLFNNGKINFSRVRSFNLDEYAGLNEEDKESLRYFMNKNFFSKVDIKSKNIYFLDGRAENFKKECRKFEKDIKDSGGIDFLILGIGRNGHIGFNEPGSGFDSLTRRVKLSEMTRKDNAALFHSKRVPKYALTMGIKTIMKARKIILLASGKSKALAVGNAIKGKITEKFPVSALQRHRNVIFILDKLAGSLL